MPGQWSEQYNFTRLLQPQREALGAQSHVSKCYKGEKLQWQVLRMPKPSGFLSNVYVGKARKEKTLCLYVCYCSVSVPGLASQHPLQMRPSFRFGASLFILRNEIKKYIHLQI